MIDPLSRPNDGLSLREQFRRRLPELSSFRRQLRILKWLVPALLVLLVIAYEVGPSRWTYERLGFTYHLLLEILLFGTVGPILAFVILELLGRWIDERETADLQAKLITQANERELQFRRLNDDTLQILFAASLLITTVKSDQADLPSNTLTQIEVTEQALDEAMQRLRSHLTDE